MTRSILAAAALVAGGVLMAVSPSSAQSLLDRPANVSGNWVGTSGVLYFHFVHRFASSDAPVRKVSNVPTFLLAVGLPSRILLGLNYSTNSTLATGYPNEYEFFARYALLTQENGSPLDVAGQVGYNLAAEGVDGEVSLARRAGTLRLIAAARVLSDPLESGETRFALAGGGTVKLNRYFALAGDIAMLTTREENERNAWSAGLHLAIPHTPHTLSLHATNVLVATLQGASRGEKDVRYGFEFTIPLTLRRYFGGAPAEAPAPVAPVAADTAARQAAPSTGAKFDAGIKGFAFTPSRIEITAGTTVTWKNNEQLAHTVIATDGSFSSPVIEAGATWSHTFAKPGTYNFTCTPHPFMKGAVVVR
ncbi:MAG: cupredoxin family copper-binding protein [Gemmatimonadaceae bacterium]